MPKVSGQDLFARCRQARGPGNIPPDEMRQLHIRLEESPMDIPNLLNVYSEDEMTHNRLATACYPEHGLPMLLYLAVRHKLDLESALQANANVGGDNVHRGMVLGPLIGAATDRVPRKLTQGLVDHDALQPEIEALPAKKSPQLSV